MSERKRVMWALVSLCVAFLAMLAVVVAYVALYSPKPTATCGNTYYLECDNADNK